MHFTHVSNLPSIVRMGGLLADRTVRDRDLTFRECGDTAIKEQRRKQAVRVPPGGVVGDYVPFYYAPRSPMLYKIWRGGVPTYQEGQEPLVYLVSSLATVHSQGLQWIGSDGNIAAVMSEHTDDWDTLEQIVDWPLMTQRQWSNTEEDGDRMRRRMAELLVHEFFPIECVEYIVAKSKSIMELAHKHVRDEIPAQVNPAWYYWPKG